MTFHKGREFAAWTGLVPKQHSTGGKARLYGIRKRATATPATVPMRDWKCSSAEKIVARRAFDVAINREPETVIREAKKRADRIRESFGP